MTEFFDFSIEPRSGNSLGMFSRGHVLWLLAALAAWLLLCRRYRRCTPARRVRMRRVTAGAALAIELLRSLLLMLAGEYGIGRLPLHLCALAIYISFLHSLRGGELTELFSASYSNFTIASLSADGARGVFLLYQDADATNGTAEFYLWSDGQMVRQREAQMSAPGIVTMRTCPVSSFLLR